MTIRTLKDLMDHVRTFYGNATGQTLRLAYETLPDEDRVIVLADIVRQRTSFSITALGLLLEIREPDRCEIAREVFWSQLAFTENQE